MLYWKCAVYLLVNRATGRIYVGLSYDPVRRLAAHRHNYRETELGADLASQPFDFRVRWYPNRTTARAAEQEWIGRAARVGRLYNLRPEGQLVLPPGLAGAIGL